MINLIDFNNNKIIITYYQIILNNFEEFLKLHNTIQWIMFFNFLLPFNVFFWDLFKYHRPNLFILIAISIFKPWLCHSNTDGHSGCFLFFAIAKKVKINILTHIFLSIYLEMEMLGHQYTSFKFYKMLLNCTEEHLWQFILLPAVYVSSYFHILRSHLTLSK